MPRYIDADKLVDFKFAYITDERYRDGRRHGEEEIYAYKVGYNAAIDNIITFATTADMVEVVRCKNCFWHNNCRYEQYLGLDGFCSRGEGKDDGFVKVVRCKDCKYYNHQHHYCEGIGNWFGYEGEWSDNGFCYKGEKREDAEVH